MGINPLQAPINYSVDVQSPFAAAVDGFKFGAMNAESQARAQAMEQARQQQAELAAVFRNPSATASDYARVAAFLPKDQAESVRKSVEIMSAEEQKNRLLDAGQVFSALKSGRADIAKDLLKEQEDAMRNAGREPEAKALLTYSRLIELDPVMAQNNIGVMVSFLPGGKDVIDNIDKNYQTARAQEKQPQEMLKLRSEAQIKEQEAKFAPEKTAAETYKATSEALSAAPLAQAKLDLNAAQIKNINSEIKTRAERLNLDAQAMQATVAEKLSSIQKNMTEIPADTRKLVNESAVAAAAAKQSAEQYNDLAKRLDAAGGGFGAATSFADYLRKTTGSQSALTELRQEYTRIRNSAAIKALPPGVATDKDIELALKGIPPENANASTMSGFLRGMGKMQDIEASVANAKTDWLINNNGTLTRARNTFQAGDYATKPGESFNDFTQRIVKDVSKRYNPATQSPLVDQIPNEFAPRPAEANIRAQADAILAGGR